MEKYFFLFAVIALTFAACDDDAQVCSCSADVNEYYHTDSVFTEGVAVPNAFSPNGDGVNDLFFVYGTGLSTLSVVVKDGSTSFFKQTIKMLAGTER